MNFYIKLLLQERTILTLLKLGLDINVTIKVVLQYKKATKFAFEKYVKTNKSPDGTALIFCEQNLKVKPSKTISSEKHLVNIILNPDIIPSRKLYLAKEFMDIDAIAHAESPNNDFYMSSKLFFAPLNSVCEGSIIELQL